MKFLQSIRYPTSYIHHSKLQHFLASRVSLRYTEYESPIVPLCVTVIGGLLSLWCKLLIMFWRETCFWLGGQFEKGLSLHTFKFCWCIIVQLACIISLCMFMMSVYGDSGTELIRELDRARRTINTNSSSNNPSQSSNAFLPSYNEISINRIATETQELCRSIFDAKVSAETSNNPHSIYCSAALYLSSITWNKRCALTYLNYRIEKLKELYWNTGRILPNNTEELLSLSEKEFFNSYSSLCIEYCNNSGLDLYQDLEPPKLLLIKVRVLKEYGAINTDAGQINLTLNSTHLMKRIEAEKLIRQGILKQIE